MGKTYKLAAEKREVTKHSAREARLNKMIPGVIYGNDRDPLAVSVSYSEFLRTYRKAGQAALVDLDVDGAHVKVVIQDYNLDPIHDTFTHVDFFAVNPKQTMTVHVPLIVVGESEAVKNEGGMVNLMHDALDIRCLPSDIPHDIEVDISSLNDFTETITIADLKLPDNLEVMQYELDEILCSISAPRIEEEEIPDEAPEDTEVPADAGTDGDQGAEVE